MTIVDFEISERIDGEMKRIDNAWNIVVFVTLKV